MAHARPSSPPPSPNTAPRAVLVVEDDDLLRKIVCRILRAEGYVVHAAVDGAEALERLAELGGSLSAVYLDLSLPITPGGEVLEQLRALWPALPVIVASGDDAGALRSGATALLPKPFGRDELVRTLRAATERAARRTQRPC